MKFRNRRSLIYTSTTILLLLVIFLLGFGIIDFRLGSRRSESAGESAGVETPVSDPVFDYQNSIAAGVTLSTDTEGGFSQGELENIRVYDQYNTAVVNITTEVVGYNWFLEAVPREGSTGSGSIFDSRGYVLTNNHVVENAYKVNITLADGGIFEGEVIGSDPENDLAVIKFDPGGQELITIPFGRSENLKVGQKVLAIGNPFAFERTLTTGIISGLGRPLRNDKGIVIRDLIQTDASINPGNSGGPLLNARGELVGVNTMIYSPSGGSVGIGFAVPVETARRVVPDLIRYGFVQRGWIDIEAVQLFPSLVRYANLPVSQGVLVSQVRPGGNADKAGIRGGSTDTAVRSGNNVIYLGGDIIIEIGNVKVNSLGDFYAALERTRPGQVVPVRLVRGKREIAVEVSLATRKGEKRMNFRVVAPYVPAGDQPEAIASLEKGLNGGLKYQTLLGVTGSGKTFTMAKTIERMQMPALVISHNKTLAAQLYREFKDFFPDNAVEYFVSYFDYYQPEAYVPARDLYIEKDSSINEEIERMRLSATMSLMERRDVIIVATVSCIYGLGSSETYRDMRFQIHLGDEVDIHALRMELIGMQYQRNDAVLERGNFRIRGDVLEIFPAYLTDIAYRISMNFDTVEGIHRIHALTGEVLEHLETTTIYAAKHFVMPEDRVRMACQTIREELDEQLVSLETAGKIVEAQRLKTRTEYDIEMLSEMGYCPGIENYSRHLTGRKSGERPEVLLDYFPQHFLTFVDESHVTLSQVRAMYEGDRSRKLNLVNFGFRLPSALDNRPLVYDEFEGRLDKIIYVSATPGKEEKKKAKAVIEQLIRPTGLLDPPVEVRPTEGQIENLYSEINIRVERHERVLVTTLTKKMAEDLTDYFSGLGLKARYLHSEIETIERVEILRDLRLGVFDVLVGINLLREGLDLPEVSLIAIMDADKIGFLRSETSLIQIIGRTARNINGQVLMYADHMSAAMEAAIAETDRRRSVQAEYNQRHGITPESIKKEIQDILVRRTNDKRAAEKMTIEVMKKSSNLLDPSQKKRLIKALENEMLERAKNMEYEEAAVLRDEIRLLKEGNA